MKVNLTIFNKIYKYNLWLFGSGSGSLAINNKPYINFLNNFIKDKSITSIFDIGCGDWQLFENINLQGVHYLGIDPVKEIIENNTKKYGTNNIKFLNKHILDYNNAQEYDLIIIKDVLQHLTNDEIEKILKKVENFKYKYLLIINDISKININIDVTNGLYRPLNINKTPFNRNYKIIYQYYEKIYLIYYLLLLAIMIYLVFTKKYKLYIFSLILLILYGFLILPTKTIFLKKNF